MSHRTLRRQLHALLDGALSPAGEAAVRAHLAACPSCRRELHALQRVEALVARLPAALVPLGAGREADSRLAGLARWARVPAPRRAAPPHWGLGALGAGLAAASFVVAIWLGPMQAMPGAADPGAPGLLLASTATGSFATASYAPAGTPYTWR
jgi:anti-sigma factor RsiW